MALCRRDKDMLFGTAGGSHRDQEKYAVRTVWWEPGALCLIDQTKLPRERETVRCARVAEGAAAIHGMVGRGAPASTHCGLRDGACGAA